MQGLSIKSRTGKKIEKEKIFPEIEFCLKEIKSLEVKDKLNEISLTLKRAEEKKDAEKIRELSEEFNQWAKKITTN